MKSLSTDGEVTSSGTDAVSSSAAVAAVTASRPRDKSQLLRQALRWVIPALVVVAILAIWQLLVAVLHLKPYFIPSPTDIASTLKGNFRYIVDNCMPTLGQAGLGFAVGNGAAILMSVWFVHVASARRVFYPLAIILQSIPLIALTPIAIVTLGNGLTTKVVMVGLISFFPTLVNLMRGLSAVDVNMLQLFQSVHASRWKVLTKLRWPNALPYLFAGLRITASAALLGAIIVEWLGSDTGLGYLIINSTYQFNTPFLWASIFVSSVLVLIAFGLVVLIERLIVPWSRTAEVGR
ncbi:MAG: ABC transporter permease [Acidimicrobiales bacterium]